MQPVVIKVGGSTWGDHDPTLAQAADLWREGISLVILHGGGALISQWSQRLGAQAQFWQGQRITDQDTLEVVVAVLAGLVNKSMVASLQALGAPAIGLSGADGALLRARIRHPRLGLVGEVEEVNGALLASLLGQGLMPVIAPVALEWQDGQPTGRLLNVNADLAAAVVAASLPASVLLLLTDVPGVMVSGRTTPHLSPQEAWALIASGEISGGMVPKVEAALRAAEAGVTVFIVDGRRPGAIVQCLKGEPEGTRIG